MTTLTVEQHKEAVKLGISHRADGLWGFKKKCVNSKCEKRIDSACYATETFAEAVHESRMRSSYSCDDECWMESGTLYPWLAEQYESEDLQEIGKCDEETEKRLLRRVKNGSTRSLAPRNKKILKAWIDHLKENVDCQDLDENEVGCEP